MKTKLTVAVAFLLLGLLTGCASSTKATLLGAGTGAAAGAGIGAFVDPGAKGRGRIKNAFVGAAAGAVIGGAAGYLVNELGEARESAAFEKGKSDGFMKASKSPGAATPNLIPAKVDVRFVDDQIKGNVFIPGHFEYVILEPARWSN